MSTHVHVANVKKKSFDKWKPKITSLICVYLQALVCKVLVCAVLVCAVLVCTVPVLVAGKLR